MGIPDFKRTCLLLQLRRAERSYSMFKVRRGSSEEITLIQGKRSPSKMVGAERGHQRAERLKPQSQKINQSNHMDHSLVELNETMSHAV